MKSLSEKALRRVSIVIVASTSALLITQDILQKIAAYRQFVQTITKEKDQLMTKVSSDGLNRFTYNMQRLSGYKKYLPSLNKDQDDDGQSLRQKVKQDAKQIIISRLKNRLSGDQDKNQSIKDIIAEKKHGLGQKIGLFRQKVRQEVIKEGQTVKQYTLKKISDSKEKIQSNIRQTKQKVGKTLFLHHFSIGSLLVSGCYVAPLLSTALGISYFTIYQLYFLADPIEKYLRIKQFKNMEFEPIYQAHLFAISTIISWKGVFKFLKMIKK